MATRGGAGRELQGWINRFKTPTLESFSPTSPGGDGTILRVRDTSGGIDTTRIGKTTDANYTIECAIYCDYRAQLAADGSERLGIFARDDGNGLFVGASQGGVQGNNYAMTWDSTDGRLRCGKAVAGVFTDLLPQARFHASSAWRVMKIELYDDRITYRLDGQVVLRVTDATRSSGPCGIGYQDLFTTNANIGGTRADNFRADLLLEAPPEEMAWVVR